MRTLAMSVTSLTLAVVSAAPHAQRPARPSFTIDQLIDIKHPSNPQWSRDSAWIAFTWDRAGVSNLFVVPADGSARPRPLTTNGVPQGYSGARTARRFSSFSRAS